MDQSGRGVRDVTSLVPFIGPCLLVPLLCMALSLSLSEVERWIASLFHSLRWSREAGRPGLTGAVEG